MRRIFKKIDFAYAAWDNVNQAMKDLDNLAPKLTGQASNEIDKIVESRLR